eukprot:1146698-Pelagomonas_calceolata.AAC.3
MHAPVPIPGCLALRTESLPIPCTGYRVIVFHQRASGMPHATSGNQVGLSSFKQITAAVFQTAIIFRLQEYYSL